MDEDASFSPDSNKTLSQRENWLRSFALAFGNCKFSKAKGLLDSGHALSKFLLGQMKQLFDAEKFFLQLRFHPPQSRLLFFHSSKEPSTSALFQNIIATSNQSGNPQEDVDVLVDLASFASCRLAFIEFLTALAEDDSAKSAAAALKKLGAHASVIVSTSPCLSPIFDRLRAEFKSLYHIFETFQLINSLRYIDALIALQQAFSRLDELDMRTGMSPGSIGLVGPVASGTTGDSWQRFYIWLRSALYHFVGKFCAVFYTALGPYLIPEANNSTATNALPGLLARSSYPDFIGRFFTLAKKFSVEMLVLICDPVADRSVMEPTFRLDLDSPHFSPSNDLSVLLSYWPSDPLNDPNSLAAVAAFNRCQNFILKLLTQHRLREVPYTTIELQNTHTILISVDSTTFLVCSYASVSRGQKESHIISAVTELAGVLRCKTVFAPLKEACLQS